MEGLLCQDKKTLAYRCQGDSDHKLTCGEARIWARSIALQSLSAHSLQQRPGFSKTMTTWPHCNQPQTNSRDGCHKVSDSYSLGLTQQFPAFYITHTHTKKKLKTQKLSRLEKKITKGSKRQLVTISVKAGEMTTDTLRGRKWKTESADSKLYGTSMKSIMTGLSHQEKKIRLCF